MQTECARILEAVGLCTFRSHSISQFLDESIEKNRRPKTLNLFVDTLNPQKHSLHGAVSSTPQSQKLELNRMSERAVTDSDPLSTSSSS